MSLQIIVLMSTLIIGSVPAASAQAATQVRLAAAAAAGTPKQKAPPIPAPAPSEHYAAAHAGAVGHPWKF
jgi:hypothetical protein